MTLSSGPDSSAGDVRPNGPIIGSLTSPQQSRKRSKCVTHVNSAPAAMSRIIDVGVVPIVPAWTGVDENVPSGSAPLPLPSCPRKSEPQQNTGPPVYAQLCCEPTTTRLAFMAMAVTGVTEGTVVPSPSWPVLFAPQQTAAPWN